MLYKHVLFIKIFAKKQNCPHKGEEGVEGAIVEGLRRFRRSCSRGTKKLKKEL